MTDVPLHFPLEEYHRRIALTRQAMAAKGLDLILVSDPSNMSWLTGYDGWSFYVHQGVLLGLEGEPVWWGRGMDAQGAKRTVFMHPDNIVGYDDTYVQNPLKHPMEQLSGADRVARLVTRAGSASRWTITGSPPPPTTRCAATCPRRPSRTRRASSTGSAW